MNISTYYIVHTLIHVLDIHLYKCLSLGCGRIRNDGCFILVLFADFPFLYTSVICELYEKPINSFLILLLKMPFANYEIFQLSPYCFQLFFASFFSSLFPFCNQIDEEHFNKHKTA